MIINRVVSPDSPRSIAPRIPDVLTQYNVNPVISVPASNPDLPPASFCGKAATRSSNRRKCPIVPPIRKAMTTAEKLVVRSINRIPNTNVTIEK